MRRSFLSPIPEYERAADLLSSAADALLDGDLQRCEACLLGADLAPLCEFAQRIAGPIDPAIHRQTKYPDYERPAARSEDRMPTPSEQERVFARDGYRCRYCSSRVILKKARDEFRSRCPSAARWGRRNNEKHCGLSVLTASVDHVLPFRRGGTHDFDNLVTACGPCQFGRNLWTLEEVEIEDPRRRRPIVDAWDGLSRILGHRGAPGKAWGWHRSTMR